MHLRVPLFPTNVHDVVRWHVIGVVSGSVAATLVMHHYGAAPGHPIGTPAMLRGLAAVFGFTIAISPLLVGLLLGARRLERQFSALAQSSLVRFSAAVVLAAIAAAAIHVGVSVVTAAVLAARDHIGFRSIWHGPFHFPEFYVIVLSGTLAWVTLPAMLRWYFTRRATERELVGAGSNGAF